MSSSHRRVSTSPVNRRRRAQRARAKLLAAEVFRKRKPVRKLLPVPALAEMF